MSVVILKTTYHHAISCMIMIQRSLCYQHGLVVIKMILSHVVFVLSLKLESFIA